MRTRVPLLLTFIACLAAALPAGAQFKQDDADAAKLGESRASQWRAGVIIRAVGGACRGLSGYVPVPTEWPEQQVTVVEEDVSSGAKISYETVKGGVKIMNFRVDNIASGQEVKATVLFEIQRSTILPPDDTNLYVVPDVKKMPRDIRSFLGPSPMIESRDARIRQLAKELTADRELAWEKVEAIYDGVRERVKYETSQIKGAVQSLKDGTGDCEGMTSLFIALCRAAEIPARTVWVPGHCYPEFYLNDDKGVGHWFPCQISGSREFGGITEMRPILQKGDDVHPPKNPKERQRYMAEYLTGTPMPGGGKPEVRWVREAVAK